MIGYSKSKLLGLLLFFLLVFPLELDHTAKIYLSKTTIQADRSSPAFSAVQDALILKDISFKIKGAQLGKVKSKAKKISLKGMRVSVNHKQQKLETVALRGEKIEVSHFTGKFIEKTSSSFSKFNPDLELAAFKSSWITPKENEEKVNLSAKSINQKTKTRANDLERRVLASGIVLTKVKEVTENKVVLKRPILASSSVSPAQILGAESYAALKVFGKIELDGGDFSRDGEFTYYIERHYDGKVFESGVLSSDEDSYKMELGSRKGFLSVELRNSYGDVFAYGEVDIQDVKDSGELNVTIVPTAGFFSGKTLDAEKSVGGKEISTTGRSKHKVAGVQGEALSDEEGYFGEDIFKGGSSFISSSQEKEYWPTLKIVESGKPLYPRLIKKSTVEKLSTEIDAFGEKIEILNILAGQVTHMGLSKRGVQVKIFGHEYYKPVYNSALGVPDPKLNKTSVDGGFLFFNLEDGGYLVQIEKKGKLLAQRWFVVKKGHISGGQIDVSPNDKAFALTEAFPGRFKTKSIVVQEVGRKNVSSLSLTSGTELKTLTKPELTAFSMKETDDLDTHIYLMSSKSLIFKFKSVSKKWLEKYLNHRRSNVNRSLGMVIGFIDQGNFRVVKNDSDAFLASSKVYYFDKNGDAIESGVEGGGFIITDVPPGFKTVSIALKGEDSFLSKIVLSSARSISIF